MYLNLSDESLFEHVIADDILAYQELYDRYHSILYLYTIKKINNSEDSYDLVQDIFVNIWTKRQSLRIKESFKSYIFTAVRNKILDKISHEKVQEKYIQSLEKKLFQIQNTDYLIREKELNDLINKEIDTMPPRMKEIFHLSRKEYLNNDEIAIKLSISKSTVETQIKRALKILKIKLNSLYLLLITFLLLLN